MERASAPPEPRRGTNILLLTESPDLESLVRAALDRLAIQLDCVPRNGESILGQWRRATYSAVLIDFEGDRGNAANETLLQLDASVVTLLLANRDERPADNSRATLIVLPAKERDRAHAAAELKGRLEFRLRALVPPKGGPAIGGGSSPTRGTPADPVPPSGRVAFAGRVSAGPGDERTPPTPNPAAPTRNAGARAVDEAVSTLEQLLYSRGAGNIELLVIGSSTGGPAALTTVFRALPTLPVPVLLVQHMPPLFTGLLARQLDALSRNRVFEAKGNEVLAPGTCFLAPGDFHLTVTRRGSDLLTSLDQNPQENSCRPSVDPMFRSAAQHVSRGVLAVILTGMGTDGTEGARRVRSAGGCVVAQDHASSVVWGMPGSVVKAGLADGVLPLDAIAGAIVRLIGDPHATSQTRAVSGE